MNVSHNIYCDESCHLMNDKQEAMILGALILPTDKVVQVSNDIKALKRKYEMDEHNELKWVKISPNKLNLYLGLMDYFLTNNDLNFRCIVIPDKSKLHHAMYGRSHDDFYYVMYYLSLKFVLKSDDSYNIYFDYKDKNQNKQLVKLKRFLMSKIHLPQESLKVQAMQSHESQLIQLTDILTGAVSYKIRLLFSSKAKTQIIDRLESTLNLKLDATSLVREDKFNVFKWTAKSFSKV